MNTSRASRVPRISPNFLYDEFLFVNVIVDIHGRAREHVVAILQHNRIIAMTAALTAGGLVANRCLTADMTWGLLNKRIMT